MRTSESRLLDTLDGPRSALELGDLPQASRQGFDQNLRRLMRRGFIRRIKVFSESARYVYARNELALSRAARKREPQLRRTYARILSVLAANAPSAAIDTVTSNSRDLCNRADHEPLRAQQLKTGPEAVVELVRSTPTSDDTRPQTVVDFWRERHRRQNWGSTKSIAEFSLDKCEEAFQDRNWTGFGYWFAVYRRERARAARPRLLHYSDKG
jgi:predicted transcriptional regulator